MTSNYKEDMGNVTFDFGVFSPEPKASCSNNIDDEITAFLDGNKCKSTSYNTNSSANRLNRFLQFETKNNYSAKHFDLLNETELDMLMCDFFMNARKIDKNNKFEYYQPGTLSNLRNGWQRYLSDHKKKIDIKNDKTFEKSKTVLRSKRKQLTRMGLGNKPNATRPLEDSEVDKLFKNRYFGTDKSLTLKGQFGGS